MPIEQIICAWLAMLWQRPTVGNTTKQKKLSTEHDECHSVCLNWYLQVKCIYLTCTLKQWMHLHHYIQTSGCLWDSAWSCHHTYIYNIFTYTIYICTWTRSYFTALCTRYETTIQLQWEWWQWFVGVSKAKRLQYGWNNLPRKKKTKYNVASGGV